MQDKFIIETSGTTGIPKRIVHTRGAFEQMAEDDLIVFNYTYRDRLALVRGGLAGYRKEFAAHRSGATLVRKEDDRPLGQWVNDQRITVLNVTTAGFLNMIKDADSFPTLRILEVGGQPVDWQDYELFVQCGKFPNCKFVVRYSTSETNVAFLWELGHYEETGKGTMPVGYPHRGVKGYILDGEIAIVSDYMAEGYLDDPEMTAKKFITHEFVPGYPKRVFLTGDEGFFDKEGRLNVIGRKGFLAKAVGNQRMVEDVSDMAEHDPAIS